MLDQISKVSLLTQILLVRFIDGTAKLCEVNENAILDVNTLNFHAIGSGQAQALNTMMFQKHARSDSLQTTIYDVYKAKKNSEVSPGVGKETDLIILLEGKMLKLGAECLKKLDSIYNEEHIRGRTDKRLAEVLSNVLK